MSGQGQVKGQKSGVFRIALTVVTGLSTVACFAQNFPITLLYSRTRQSLPTSDYCFIFSPGQGQGQVRKGHHDPKLHQMSSFDTCFIGPFWTKNLDSQRLFYILTSFERKKNRKAIQGQVKKSQKKVKFSQFIFLKTKRTCFWSRITSAIQWCTISFPVYVGYNWLKKCAFKFMTSSHWALWGRQKHPFWGSKIDRYRVWKFAHWLNYSQVSTIHIFRFFENFENFGFYDHFF